MYQDLDKSIHLVAGVQEAFYLLTCLFLHVEPLELCSQSGAWTKKAERWVAKTTSQVRSLTHMYQAYDRGCLAQCLGTSITEQS